LTSKNKIRRKQF